jgi:hypothetical protein
VEDIVRIATPWAKHLSRAQIVKKLTKGRPAALVDTNPLPVG